MRSLAKKSYLLHVRPFPLTFNRIRLIVTLVIAWPCCIQHEKGLKEPRLTYDQAPFMHALATIRERKIGTVMDSNWERNMWDLLPNSTQKNDKLYNDSQWVLPMKAVGREAVHKLLNDINDICRICIRFELPSEVVSTLKWPTISVEFSSLPDNNSVDFKVRTACTL